MLCSTPEDKKTELEHLKKVLSISGYNKWMWDLPSSKKSNSINRKRDHQAPKGHVTLPYVQGISEAISRKIRKTGVQVHTKPINTIRSRLVAPKDKVDTLEKCGVIYHIECRDCSAAYVGETERCLGTRVKEHQREASPVAEHMARQHQAVRPVTKEEVRVLDNEPRLFQRGVKEAIYIAAHNPVLNRDKGRYTLPASYNTLIRSNAKGLGLTPNLKAADRSK